MKILHTADWHLGKNLEGESRMEEQEEFLNDFVNIVRENKIDMVIIAGDIYDSSNPPARAERMFYKTLKEISDNGKRMILIIAGNHDNPDRLVAASPLAYEQGILFLSKPKSCVEIGKCGLHRVVDAGEGYLEVDIKGERAVIITMPYPSEKRLNEVIYDSIEDDDRQKAYTEKLGELFTELSKKFREDTINIAVSHLFVVGGEESSSERNIQLGGSLAVKSSDLPLKAQYIALGHLHRPQEIKNKGTRIVYAGSPLQYSKSEIGYSKCCYIVDIKAGYEPEVSKVLFKNYKPIEVWKCENVEEAIEKCKQNSDKNMWVYLEIKTDKFITQEEMKIMKSLKKDILEIKPIIIGSYEEDEDYYNIKEKSMSELFREFYKKQREVEPTEELMELFLNIIKEEGGEE